MLCDTILMIWEGSLLHSSERWTTINMKGEECKLMMLFTNCLLLWHGGFLANASKDSNETFLILWDAQRWTLKDEFIPLKNSQTDFNEIIFLYNFIRRDQSVFLFTSSHVIWILHSWWSKKRVDVTFATTGSFQGDFRSKYVQTPFQSQWFRERKMRC